MLYFGGNFIPFQITFLVLDIRFREALGKDQVGVEQVGSIVNCYPPCVAYSRSVIFSFCGLVTLEMLQRLVHFIPLP